MAVFYDFEDEMNDKIDQNAHALIHDWSCAFNSRYPK